MSSKQELFCASFAIFVIVLGLLSTCSNASQALFFAKPDPDNPDNCIFEKEHHKVGKIQMKNECAVIDCASDCVCAITG